MTDDIDPTNRKILRELVANARIPISELARKVGLSKTPVALRIRQRARDHNVPIWSDPPCARALHAAVRIGDEIPRSEFGPVAAAIRFAEAMRARARRGYEGRLEGAAK